MANLIELLEDGLAREDWTPIMEAYKTLTGKAFTVAQPPFKQEREAGAEEENEIEEEEPLPSSIILPSEEEIEEFTTEDDIEDLDAQEERQKCRKIPFDTSKKKNSWKDNRQLAIKDIEIDKKLHTNQVDKCIEKRPPAKKVKITCEECKRPQIIFKHLAPASLGESGRCRYVCDRCITRKRGKD